MLKKLKTSFQNNQLSHLRKMTPLTRVGTALLLLSLVLAMPMLATVVIGQLFQSVGFESGLIPIWITYIVIAIAATLSFDYGRGNLSFLIAMSSPLVQVLSGYYQYWYGIFNISVEDVFLSLENGLPLGVFLLYVSNGIHLLALVALVLGRRELQKIFRSFK